MIPISLNKFHVFLIISAILLLSQNPAFPQLFGPQQQITGCDLTNVSMVYSDDLNNDNKPDVIGESFTKVVWYKNLGEGNFDFQKTIVDSLDGVYSATADFDGDGDIDIAYASCNDYIVGWYENDGIGNFEMHHIITLDTILPGCINSADMDSDGDMDLLLVSNRYNQVIMFRNDGNGNFALQQVLLTFDYGYLRISISDMDNDDDKDILISYKNYETSEDEFFWLENDGNGCFLIQHNITNIDISIFYVDDIDGDGDEDILYSSCNDYEIAWFENEGNGIFGSKHIVDNDVYSLGNVCSFDFDNDGDNDILAGTYAIYGIFWYENEGNEVFSEKQSIYMSQGIVALFPRDFDDDGYADFAAAIQFDNSRICWFKNQGNKTFSGPLLLTTKAKYASDVYAGDIDNDGDNDIISASAGEGKIVWYENISYQNFGPEILINEQGNHWSSKLVSCDFDNDNDLDIFGDSWSIVYYENIGEANFDTAKIINNYFEVSNICLEDLNGDEKKDLVAATYEGIQWSENLGNGNFGTKQTIEWIYDYDNKVFANDLDGDHDIDILFERPYGSNIAYYKNDGKGNFSDRTSIYTAATPRDIWAVDLDNDGSTDIIAAVNHKVIWFKNLGNGNFGVEQLISDSVVSPYALFTTDLDNDGYNDILYGYSSKVIWHKNMGGGTFGYQQIITNLASGVSSIFASDIDNDGDKDVLSASFYDGKIAWYENLLITINSEEIDDVIDNVQIYPNPIKNYVNINSPVFDNGNFTCELIDIYGRLIKRIEIPKGQISTKINTLDLKKGLYFVRLIDANKNNTTFKVIKI